MATKSGEIEIFQFHIEYSLHTLWVKNSVEIALSLTVSEILTFFQIFFVFRKNSRWPPKVAKIEIFLILYRILFYYPVSQKFCPNRSISYDLWDIKIFSFFAKIQDGRQKWRKLKIFNFVQNSLLLPCESNIVSKSLYLLWFPRY